MNFDILYEIVMRDMNLNSIDFQDQKPFKNNRCEIHDRKQHFFCNNHKTIMCRACISGNHSGNNCYVTNLDEIHKLVRMVEDRKDKNQKSVQSRNEHFVEHLSIQDLRKEELI